MVVIKTERLHLRQFAEQDAGFVVELLNQPSFLRYIGDRGVRTQQEAIEYMQQGPIKSYHENGFGLYIVESNETDERLGTCGLVKRKGLDDVDIGYAFLPQFWSQGYAFESAEAVLSYGIQQLGLVRIVAITASDNQASIRLLEKLGMKFESMIQLPDDEEEIMLYAMEA